MKINQQIFAQVIRILLCIATLVMAFCCGYGQCNTGNNLALNRPVVASSLENAAYPASNAVDGNTGTRWSSNYTDNEYIYIDLGSSKALCQVVLSWEYAYGKNFTIDLSNNASTWTTASTISNNGSLTNIIPVTGTARYVRMKGTLRGTGYGYSLYEFQVFGTAASPACPATNIAQSRPGIISSLENAIYPASNAFDGNLSTRWSSAFSDPQSIYVDLGTSYALCGIDLTWENAYGANYEIDGSNNAVSWTTLSTVIGNSVLNNTLSVSGSYRYVRMLGTARGTGFGYSLYEFAVHGSAILPVTISGFSAVDPDNGMVILNWSATAVPDAGFVIQRSSDAVLFDSVGQVTGNRIGAAAYHFSDQLPGSGIYYYRLKQRDADGLVIFSSIIQVKADQPAGALLYLFPNPAGNWFTLKGRGLKENADLQITDMQGNLVKKLRQVSPAEPVSVADLPAGMYLVAVRTPSCFNMLKLIRK